jgi:hypothetical protein
MTPDPWNAGLATQTSAPSQGRPANRAPAAWNTVGSWVQPYTLGEPYFEAYPQSTDPAGGHTDD